MGYHKCNTNQLGIWINYIKKSLAFLNHIVFLIMYCNNGYCSVFIKWVTTKTNKLKINNSIIFVRIADVSVKQNDVNILALDFEQFNKVKKGQFLFAIILFLKYIYVHILINRVN